MDAYRLLPRLEPADPDETIERLAGLARGRSLAFFFGAGFSRAFPSLNPLVAPSQGLPGLHSLLQDMIAMGCPEHLRPAIVESLNKDPLEVVLENLNKIIGDVVFDFLDILEAPPRGLCEGPNYNHLSLALLAKAGVCRHFLTVNFDTLLEQAFDVLKAGRLIVPEERSNEKKSYAAAVAETAGRTSYLFKLHGTMRQSRRLLTTLETVGLGLPPYKGHLIRELLTANSCFFMGYRANDLDIFPLLEALPPTTEMFWFDIALPKDIGSLGAFLARRPHRLLISPDLSAVLQSLLHRLGIDDAPVLNHLGVTSLSDIPECERAAVPEKAATIRAFAERFHDQAVPPEAARLMMSIALHPGDSRADMRDELFASVAEAPVPEPLQFGFNSQLAERHWSGGRFRDAITARREAIRALKRTTVPRPFRVRNTVEQRLYIASHYYGLARSADRLVYRWCRTFQGLWYSALSAVQLSIHTRSLTDLERGRLWIRFPERFARHEHGIIDERLLDNIRTWVSMAPGSTLRGLALADRVRAAVAIRLYRVCLDLPFQAYGWKTLVMRNLAMVLMHRAGSCPPEARRLILEARMPNERATGGDKFSRLGVHEAFCLMYEGAFQEAEDVLAQTLRFYRDETQYRRGQILTRFAEAFCFAMQGKREEARNALEEHDRLRQGTA